MVKIGQNMSKGKIWKKEVIDALRLSSCSKKELIELVMAKDPKLARIKVKEPKRAYEAARKRIERFLDDLISLGLVEEKGGRYYWYMYPNIFKNREDYFAKLQHSRILIPALKEIAGIEREVHAIDPENLKILVECAEEHLSYYPVHDLLTERRQKLEEAEEKEKTFMESLARRLEEEFGELTDPVRATRDFVGENIPSQIYYCIYYKIKPHKYFEYKNDELWFRNTLIARGFNVKEFIIREIENRDNIKAVEEIKRLREKVSKISEEIKCEIHKLILKIESGEPLIGKCRTCPEVTL